MPGIQNKNVILITIDSLRKDMLGCYGSGKNLTPFIDSLQNRCIRFTRGQTTGPNTLSSFPGILASSYFLEYGKSMRLSSHQTIVSEVLKNANITTAAYHSNPYLCGDMGWNRGWTLFYDSMKERVEPMLPYIPGDKINLKVMNWLESYVTGIYRPFFLWVHYMDMHEPYVPEKKYVDRLYPEISMSKEEMFNLFKTYVQKKNMPIIEKVDILRKLYEVHAVEVDTYVQALFETLEKMKVLEDSVVILTSDHGEEFGEHGGMSHRDKMYAEMIDMPLLIFNGGESGECNSLVSSIDISPTICHLFGVKMPAKWEGRPLLPLDGYISNKVFGEAIDMKSRQGGNLDRDIYFLREEDLKLIYRPSENNWEMYDLHVDPMEQKNIVDCHPEAEAMKSMLIPRVRRWKRQDL